MTKSSIGTISEEWFRVPPNFCSSECAGRVLVPIQSRRRRIAKRFRKARSAAKLLALLAGCLLAQGCVGFVVARTKTQTFAPPSIGDKPATSAVWARTGNTDNVTGAWLQGHWGKPASVMPASPESQGELWMYNLGTAWCGAIPCLVVPIPLVLPVAHQKVVFLMQEGQVVSADVTRFDFSGAYASMLGPDGGPIADAKW